MLVINIILVIISISSLAPQEQDRKSTSFRNGAHKAANRESFLGICDQHDVASLPLHRHIFGSLELPDSVPMELGRVVCVEVIRRRAVGAAIVVPLSQGPGVGHIGRARPD
jgi:hypothetical protein